MTSNSAVTHEAGHNLGFRHSDQTRADDPSIARTIDATLECSNTAIGKAFITTGLNGALQAWDQHAIDAVYLGSSATAPAAPSGVNARATAATRVVVTWNAASGAISHAILRRDAGVALRQIGTSNRHTGRRGPTVRNEGYVRHDVR